MLQVKQIVNSIFTSNTYLVFDDEYDYCWLVDIGDYTRVSEALPKGMKVKGLFLTHTHFDHTYGINALHKAHPKCIVYTSAYGWEALHDDKKNLSRYHEASFTYKGGEIVVLDEGNTVELFPKRKLIAYATSGHCPSCLTFCVGDYIFTGDSYLPGVKVVTKLPKGNKRQAFESIKKILHLAEGKTICPGHGEMVKCVKQERKYNHKAK